MTRIEQLDKIIQHLYICNVDNKLIRTVDIPHSDEFDIDEIDDVIGRLVNLGYVICSDEGYGCTINFEGRLFYENTPKYKWFYHNKPFQYENFKKNLQTFWTGLKTVGLILNGLALLFLGYWSLKVSNKTNDLEKELDSHRYINKTLEDKINKSSKDMEKFIINSKAEIN
jgi:hypothetical protein